MYKQDKPFNQNTAGKVAGSCLQNVRLGYGIGSKYPNAITAWGHTEQHGDRSLPSGCDVPLYYTYKVDGHINVRLVNGQVWSDGNLYTSLDDYLVKHPAVAYLGWGESVNDVRVIELMKGADVSTVGEYEFHIKYEAYFGPMERNQPSAADRSRWIGAESNTVDREMEADPRHAAWLRYISDLEKAGSPSTTALKPGLYKVS